MNKAFGGLGLRNLRHMNKAGLVKLGWNLLEVSNSLRYQVVRNKYGRGKNRLDSISAKSIDSSFWKQITKICCHLIF